MRGMGRVARIAVLFSLCAGSARGAVLQMDDFEVDNEGWGFFTGGAVAWDVVPDGGPTGAGDGFLQFSAGSLGSNQNLAAVNGSENWSGDFLSVGAEKVTVDFMVSPESDPVDLRLILFGPTSNSDRWSSTTVAQVPNDGVWRSYEFSLAEEDFIYVTGGTPFVTADFNLNGKVEVGDLTTWETSFGIDDGADANFDGVSDGTDFLQWQRRFGDSAFTRLLGSVTQVMFRHNPEPMFGGTFVNALAGMDNVALVGPTNAAAAATGVPEPGALGLLTCCVLTWMAVRRVSQPTV